MAKNRKAAEEFIIKYIDKIAPGGANKKIYQDFFAKLTNEEFDKFMLDLESGDKFLVIHAPNFSEVKITVPNNLKIAEELGHQFFTKLWIEGKGDVPTYLTPVEYLVIDLPVRRASQLLTKKIRVPEHTKVVDALSGQVTGESKGARISHPELQVAASMGLEKTMIELMKYRGGDLRGNAALTGMMTKYGKANIQTLSQFASGVESTKTLSTLLTCAMLKSTLTS